MSWSIQPSFVKIRNFGLSPNFNLIWTQSVNRVQYRIPTQYLVRISDNVLYLISEVVVQSNNWNNVPTYTNEGLCMNSHDSILNVCRYMY